MLVTAVVYANSLGGEFLFDDLQFVRNPQAQNIETLSDAVDFSGFRRLTFMTYGLNVYLGGMNPLSFHIVNVLIHAINVALIYMLLMHFAGGVQYPAAVGALIFAVHPLFTEAVSYVSGRYSALCGTFYFLAVLTFIKGLDTEVTKKRIFWFSVTAISGVLAWHAKQDALALPVTLAALTWISGSKKNWKVLTPLVGALALALFYYRDSLLALFRNVGANTALVAAGADPALPFPTYLWAYVSSIVGYYVPRLIVPLGPFSLSADPYVPTVESWFSPEFIFSAAVLGGLSWLIVQGSKFDRWVMAGVVTLIVSPLTAYAFSPLADPVLEHRAYIPGLGIAVLWGWLARSGFRRYGKASVVGILVVAGLFSIMTVRRNVVWKDNLTFWETLEADSSENARPHLNLGQQFQSSGRIDEAIREYQHALEIRPNLVAASSNLAAILLNRGQFDEAEPVLLDLTRTSPSFAEGWVNLGALYMNRREFDQALAAYDRALEADPNSAAAFLYKGNTLTEIGNFDAALENYRRAMDLRPDAIEFKLDLAMHYYRSGDHPAAERELVSLRGTPIAAAAYMNLGMMSMDAEDYPSALEYFKESARIRSDVAVLNQIGFTYLAMDMPDAAIEEFQNVLQAQPGYGPSVINMAIAYQEKKEDETAEQILRQFLRVYPSSPFAARARERLETLN